MKNQLPYGGDRKSENSARTDRVMGNGYKSGGSVSDDAGTKISITIGAPPTQDKQNQGLAGLAALAQAAKPPMPPPMAPPPGPGGPGAPPPMGMKTGGRVSRKQGGAANMDAGAGGGKGRLEKAGMK